MLSVMYLQYQGHLYMSLTGRQCTDGKASSNPAHPDKTLYSYYKPFYTEG